VGGGRGATKGRVDGRWRGDDDVRVLALARCCRRRGEDVTINIGGRWEVGGGRWEVGGGRVTKGGGEVVAVRGGSRCRRPLLLLLSSLLPSPSQWWHSSERNEKYEELA
jgi:hypothetical protein